MAVGGYIKLFRQMTEWEWYQDGPVVRVFLHLLLTANHEDKRWCGKVIKRGQVVTSREKLAVELGLSERQIRTALEKLASTGEILRQATNKYTLISICKYADYQVNDDTKRPAKSPTSDQQATNERPTNDHKQEYKEIEEYKNIYSTTTIKADDEKFLKELERTETEFFTLTCLQLKIESDVYFDILQIFKNECKIREKYHLSMADTKQHFMSFARGELDRRNKQKTANNGINNTSSKRGYFEPDANQVYSDGFNQ